jgi:hypothetical protein
MIKYALVCKDGHEFESWFPNSESYDKQAKRGFVVCPVCQSPKVSKAIMAPQVARKDRARGSAPVEEAPTEAPAAGPAPAAPAPQMALLDERQIALRAAIRELRSKMIENSVDVGSQFPEEARKIHDGSAPARSIRGQASLEEAKALIEEGVPLMPIPDLPEERN